ncbi:T9SS type A sorting domain-containing protein [candidate division WOR-3 bacterium]|nr:T9SS type A sorting domain-containing protein [candidate division WOR-3 bacterium]
MKSVYLIMFFSFLVASSPLLAEEKGSFEERRKGVHDANRVRTTFFNYGLIGRMSPADDFGCEWPMLSGHDYISDVSVLVGIQDSITMQVIDTIIGTDTIYKDTTVLVHPVEVNDSPRGNNEYSPDGTTFWGWEPIPGYANPDTNLVAMSDAPETWPPYWPDKLNDPDDPGWSGSWNGYFGKDVFRADKESYFVMDDDSDEEFPFYPDSTDSTRRGLGLEVKVRGLQWDFPPQLQDIIFWIYEIKNVGTTHYDTVMFGTLVGTIPGGNGDTEDDCADYSLEDNIAYAYDWDGVGAGGWSPVGYAGYAFLRTPDDLGLTSFYYFHPFNRVKLRNDEQLWECMEPGYFVNQGNNVDGDFIIGSGYFSLSPGETKEVITAIVMGEDSSSLLHNVRNAKSFVDGNFAFNSQPVIITFPCGGEELSGEVTITWENEGASSVNIFYSSDWGESWDWVAMGELNDGEYLLNTEEFPDGIGYLLYLQVVDENNVITGEYRMDSVFTINNPGNAIPEVVILSPQGGECVTGEFEVEWIAGDADGEDIIIDIFLTNNDGVSYETITTDEINDGVYNWDTPYAPNGINSKLRILARDQVSCGEDTSLLFTIYNPRVILPDSNILHYQGYGTGIFSVRIVDSAQITNYTYRVTFDTTGDYKTYSVYNQTSQQFLILDDPHLSGNAEGPLFDGFRLLIDDEELSVNDSLSGWISGDCNYEISVDLSITPLFMGTPFPVDLEFIFSDTIVDTSTEYQIGYPYPLDLPAQPTKFLVWNVTKNKKAKFAYCDRDDNGISNNDFVFLLHERDTELIPSWNTHFEEPVEPVAPGEGDTLFIHIDKPFTPEDTFLFSMGTIEGINIDNVVEPPSFWLSMGYPNPFSSKTVISYHLPIVSMVNIKIYNILGQEVKAIINEKQKVGYHSVVWDGRDNEGIDVPSGIYFYRIVAEVKNGVRYDETRKIVLLR